MIKANEIVNLWVLIKNKDGNGESPLKVAFYELVQEEGKD